MLTLAGLLVPLLLMFVSGAMAQEKPGDIIDRIKWVTGPAKVKIGNVAEMDLPAGYQFTDAEGARLFAQATQNLSDPSELGVVVPTDMDWYVVISFSDQGYVKDEEGSTLDTATCNAMLSSIKEGTEAANKEKARLGMSKLFIHGWEQSPSYDSVTHRLTWAIRASDGNSEQVVNYNSRFLGRDGVLSANMVVSPEQLQGLIPTYRKMASAVTFVPGRRYDEFRPGDRIAEYGLAALVTGGTAVVAIKWWKPLLKFGVMILVAIGGLFAKFKNLITGGGSSRPASVKAARGGPGTAGPAWVALVCPDCGNETRVRVGSEKPTCGKCRAPLT